MLAALLGRGGFSEVHKAYDTQSLKFVAVKVGVGGYKMSLINLVLVERCR